MARDSLQLKKLHIQTMIQVTIDDSSFCTDGNMTTTSLTKSQLHSQLERQLTLITALIHNIDTLVGRSISEDLMYLNSALNEKQMSVEERTILINQKNELETNRESIEKGFLKSLKTSNSDLEIKSKPLKNILPENERFETYERELAQIEDDQFTYIISLTEKTPINWWAVLTVAGAAILQLVAGASATIFSLGAGAAVGFAFMQEGISDLIYAVKSGIIERNFDWATYGIQKAISLTITICCFGFSAIKSAAKGALNGAKALGKVVMGTANRVTKEGLKLACKAIGKVVTIEVSKVALSSTMNYVCGESLEAGISGLLQSKIAGILQSILAGNEHLTTLIEVAQISRSLQYIEIFTKRVMTILYQSPAFMSELQQITTTIYKKFTKSSNQLLKMGEKLFQNMDILVIISKLTTILNDLPKFLESIVAENTENIQEILGTKDVDVAVENATPVITESQYIGNLSEQISGIISSRIAGFAKQFAVSQKHLSMLL
uniref:Uncharacterized protein n=1 Tax=Panagrolaimus davidi TaxID=227884 RepID=A0A914PHR9_9BILA